MRVAITSQGPTLDSPMDPRFGRAAYFIIYDLDRDEMEVLQNPAQMTPGGAGIQSAQLIISKGVNYVISGSFGPNALPALEAGGIVTITGNWRTVREALEAFKKGEYQRVPSGGFERAPVEEMSPEELSEYLQYLEGLLSSLKAQLETFEKGS